ncbi:hypothetical protein [Bradyrhizobium stylosanthis]
MFYTVNPADDQVVILHVRHGGQERGS